MTSSGRATARSTAVPKPIRTAFLTSRLGRRLFAVFVLSALLPLGALAVMSYLQVSRELLLQTDQRLHRAARATGEELARRLFARSAQLPRAASDASGFRWVARVDASQRPHAVVGEPDAEVLRRVAEAKLADPGLLVVPAVAAEARVILTSGPADGIRFVGELDVAELFAQADIYSYGQTRPERRGRGRRASGRLLSC